MITTLNSCSFLQKARAFHSPLLSLEKCHKHAKERDDKGGEEYTIRRRFIGTKWSVMGPRGVCIKRDTAFCARYAPAMAGPTTPIVLKIVFIG